MKSGLLKKILIAIVIILALLQFVRQEKNQQGVYGLNHIKASVEVPEEVDKLLTRSCYDCHSNSTHYPWYTAVQPFGIWIQHHVDEGKAELNFSEFATYSPKRKAHKMEEVAEMLEANEMPLGSYTLIHKEAVLSEAEKQLLVEWAKRSYAAIKSAP